MSNRHVIEKAIECFGDPSRRREYFDLYSESVVVHGYQGIEPGKANVERFYEVFWNAFPDVRVDLQDVVEQGDTVAIRYEITGTQQQEFLGIPAAQQRIRLQGQSFLLFRNGECIERWACSDSMILLSQLREAGRE